MKKYLFLIACMLNCMLASAQYSGSGNGTEDDPYLIYNETQLYQINNFLGSDHAGVVFKLMKDLDLTDFISDNFPSEGWIPVGVESTPFEGILYGNGHTISGLWINRQNADHIGLFGWASGITITDLTLNVSSIAGQNYVGAICGTLYGTNSISNCNVNISGIMTANCDLGAIVGYCHDASTISGCNVEGNLESYGSSSLTYGTVGGLFGTICNSNISNCSYKGNTIKGKLRGIGGLAGSSHDCTITNTKVYVDLVGESCIGGIVGILEGSNTISNCHSNGKITNTGDYTGGIIGISNGGCIAGMENCSHFGDINGKNYVGGLIGATLNVDSGSETIYISTSSTENTKSVSMATSEFVTGTDEPLVNNCTAIGNITGSTYIGGLVGWDEKAFGCSDWSSGGKATISSSRNCYLWYGDSYTGLYGYWADWSPNIRVKTLAYTNSYYSGIINGTDNVGGIAGYKWCGKIQNCYTNATVYGNKNVGGIIGNAEGYSTATLTLKSDVAINNTISATEGNIGRIYGTKNDYLTIGALASAEGNRALTTTKVIKQGVVQEVTDDFQNGNVMGKSLLKLKANYVALGWDFDNNWDILETECFPYKKYQAAPPVIESNLVSQDTEISGSSLNGGTVYLYYKDRDAVSTTCTGNAWSFTIEALQSGANVQLYADVEGKVPSYFTSATVGYPGSGTEADPYRIYTAEDLQGASNRGYYKLMNDIDLTSWINENSPTEGWVAIGRNSGEATYINGDGHKVTGLWINSTQDYTGLFSNFSAGIIKNLSVEVASGKKVKGGDYTGVLIGRNANGQLLNCIVKGDVEGTVHVGGVTGYSGNNTVNAITYEGKVTTNTANAYVGGFAGFSENDAITAVHVYPTISATGTDSNIGGAIGYMNGGTITKSQAENTLAATGANDYVGGLVGYSKGDITLSYSTGTVTASGDNSYTGGLVGYAYNPITNCYSTVETTGTYYTAGICAYTFSAIDKCYAKGDVYGSRYGGGVVAKLDGSAAALTNSIAANNKLDLSDQAAWGSRVIGGFSNGAAEPDASNYALSTMQVSLNGVPQKKTDDAVEGIAKAESDLMKAQTYSNLCWDFTDIWTINEGAGYPTFQWEVSAVPTHNIIYMVDGVVYQTETYAEGATITPIVAPTKEGYTFSGWSEIPATMGTADITITGTFTKDESQSGDSGSGSGSTDISKFDNVVYASDATSSAGVQLELEFNLKNATSISDLQFDLYLPTGVTVAYDEDDFALIDVATDRTTAKKHSVDYQEQADGSMRIMCTSSKGYTFDGNDGAVVIVTLNMADDLEEGDYDIILKNIVMSNSEESFQVSKVVSTLTISNYTIGDVNADGLINVADLSKLVKMILNSTEVSDNASKAGDINCDNTLNVADYSKLVQMILNAPSSNAKKFTGKFEAKRTSSSAYLEVEPVSIAAGQEQQVAVLLSNSDVTANGIQMDIVLPEGLTIDADNIVAAARAKGFDVIFNGNRLILCDINGSNIDGNDGILFYLPVKADESLMDGSYSILFSNVVLSDINCESVSVNDVQIPVEVSQATGINGVMMFGNLAITTGHRILTVQATAEQNVVVRSIDGKIVSSRMLNRGEKEILYLASGVYMINNNKVIIK